jgi:hypothetical protein
MQGHGISAGVCQIASACTLERTEQMCIGEESPQFTEYFRKIFTHSEDYLLTDQVVGIYSRFAASCTLERISSVAMRTEFCFEYFSIMADALLIFEKIETKLC